jgi:hypothetical protein
MTLDASGNLGIGTSSPGYKLSIAGAAGSAAINLLETSVRSWAIRAGGTATNTFDIADLTAGQTRLTLDSSGNLGLGVTPSAWGGSFKAFQIASGGTSLWSDGSVAFYNRNTFYDGTNRKYVVDGFAQEYAQLNDGSHAWKITTSGSANGNISFTQAMTLDASGNLIVADTSPAYSFSGRGNITIGGTSGSILGFRINSVNKGYIYHDGTNLDVNNVANGYLSFATNNTERARITSGGDLLVGQSAKSQITVGAYLSANGEASACMAASTDSTTQWNTYSTGAGAFRFYVGMGGTVYATNTTISAISDQRLKENIQDLDGGLDKIMALKPRKFDWKAGKGKDIKGDRGFIAQEFEQVFPDLIDEWKDPAPEGEEPYKSVRADLIPVLVKALQEQQALINDLRARVAQLEAK